MAWAGAGTGGRYDDDVTAQCAEEWPLGVSSASVGAVDRPGRHDDGNDEYDNRGDCGYRRTSTSTSSSSYQLEMRLCERVSFVLFPVSFLFFYPHQVNVGYTARSFCVDSCLCTVA